jgi:Rieske Fe-S protein
VFEQTEVTQIDPPEVKAGGYKIGCREVFIATHVPLQGAAGTLSAALFQTKLAPYTTYAIGARIPAGLVAEASYWDTADPYLYLRVDEQEGQGWAILGGADHKTGQSRQPEEHYAALEKRMRELVAKAVVEYRWSGQVIETSDGLPFIGETASHQFAATGFSGNGITFGTLGAMMMRDAFRGRKNPWSELFSPQRKVGLSGVWDYLKENADYPYYMAKKLLEQPEEGALREIRRGEGKVILLKGAKVAAYRDPEGNVILRSAICPHLGCVVRWNGAEKTWDCPCHGSRFAAKGSVIAGPAETELADAADE